MIWIITAMLWYHDIPEPSHSTYNEQSFNTKAECLDHVFWNKAELVYKLVEVHGVKEGNQLKTWAFFCENRHLEEV
tara:strand:+ start:513 stop:740 length:228 start_codon:yes stop_codon:yes gene_type:complete